MREGNCITSTNRVRVVEAIAAAELLTFRDAERFLAAAQSGAGFDVLTFDGEACVDSYSPQRVEQAVHDAIAGRHPALQGAA